MERRGYHQVTLDGVPRTSYCHGVWAAPFATAPCADAAER